MARFIGGAIAAALIGGAWCQAANADEVEDALQFALEAYQAGDIDTAKEEIDFASQLLSQMKAAGLSDFLPQPLPGWQRVEGDTQTAAAFGGGQNASASYTRGQDQIDVELTANSQMVTAMSAMFSNVAMMGSMGQVKRINRQKVVLTQSGELQAMIDNRIFVQITGRAPVEDKEAYFAAIDLRALENF